MKTNMELIHRVIHHGIYRGFYWPGFQVTRHRQQGVKPNQWCKYSKVSTWQRLYLHSSGPPLVVKGRWAGSSTHWNLDTKLTIFIEINTWLNGRHSLLIFWLSKGGQIVICILRVDWTGKYFDQLCDSHSGILVPVNVCAMARLRLALFSPD